MTDRDALYLRVLQLLRDPAAVSGGESFAYSEVEILANMEEARREIQSKLAVRFPEKVSAITTMTYASELASTPLPASPDLTFATIATVRARPVSSSQSVDYRILKAVNLTRLQEVRVSGGYPTYYALQGGNIWLAPRPDEGQTLSIVYVPDLVDLATGADSPTELPSRFHHLISYEAAVSLQEQSGAQSPLAYKRDQIMEGLLEFLHNLAPDTGVEGGL